MIMNKLVYLGLSILDLSKTIIYEFWYDYVKLKYDEKIWYMDTDSFIVHVKTYDVDKDIAKGWNMIWHFKFWNRQTVA